MTTIGIDAGMDYTKVVLLREDGTCIWRTEANLLEPTQAVAERALQGVLQESGLTLSDVDAFCAMGVGQEETGLPVRIQPAFYCIAQGAERLCPGVGTVVDMGSRRTLALLCRNGIAYKTSASEKCASGAGSYLNMVSSFLDLDLQQMNRLYYETDQEITLETKCAVFAESEIISLVHRRVPVPAIVRGAFNGLANRVRAQMLGLPPGEQICVVGGIAMLPAAMDALQRKMGAEIVIPDEPRIAGALGAAILAQKAERGVTAPRETGGSDPAQSRAAQSRAAQSRAARSQTSQN